MLDRGCVALRKCSKQAHALLLSAGHVAVPNTSCLLRSLRVSFTMTSAMNPAITLLIRVLEFMFVAGLAGSAIVLVATIIDLVIKDTPAESTEVTE